jgi:hypothetical protein
VSGGIGTGEAKITDRSKKISEHRWTVRACTVHRRRQKLAYVVAVLMALIVMPRSIFGQPTAGAPLVGSLGPVGGGSGYSDFVLASQAQYLVETTDELVDAFAAVQPGEIIYVADDAEIEIRSRSQLDLILPAGAILASGRGRNGSPGAVIAVPRYTTMGVNPLIHIVGPGARVTGLRLRGPVPFQTTRLHNNLGLTGIKVEAAAARIDNCELFGWTHAVRNETQSSLLIEYCSVHHNLFDGLGYGISMIGACSATIQYNVFNSNRHGISGTGHFGQSYDAQFNWFGSETTSHAVDVHGGCDRGDGTVVAGTKFTIWRNSFASPCTPSVRVRGIPDEIAIVTQNLTVHTSLAQAFQQIQTVVGLCGSSSSLVHMTMYNNVLGGDACASPPSGVCDTLAPFSREGFDSLGSWTSAGNRSRWFVGDFNGDGRDDVMRRGPTGNGAEVLLALANGSGFGTPLAWTNESPGDQDWLIGDFNGDKRSDLLRYVAGVGVEVLISDGSGFLNPLGWTGYGNRGRFWVGDFNGDGKDDLLRTASSNGGAEVLRSNGSQFRQPVAWTGEGQGDLGWYVGDFNGDGRTDLLRHFETSQGPENRGGQQVLVSTGEAFGPPAKWGYARLDSASGCTADPLNRFYVGDFDGSGGDDLAKFTWGIGTEMFLGSGCGDAKIFEYDGRWSIHGYGDQDWYLGDFTGDGRDDLLRYRQGISGAEVYASLRSTLTSSGVPRVQNAPANASVCKSGAASFLISAAGSGPFTYQWQIECPTSPGTWTALGNNPAPLPAPGGGTAFAFPINSPSVSIGIRDRVGVFSVRCIITNSCASVTSNVAMLTVSQCDCIDFNNDGSSFDPEDIDAFLSVFSEGPCVPATAICNDIDFNNDGSLFDPCDIDSLLLVFSEGPCTPCGG